jgi:hypothetical protein
MPEPDEPVKDFDGYTWVKNPLGGWDLKNHDQLCYLQQPWKKVEAEYGPMKLMS